MIPLTRAISERIRGGYDDALYNSTFTFLYFTVLLFLDIHCTNFNEMKTPVQVVMV